MGFSCPSCGNKSFKKVTAWKIKGVRIEHRWIGFGEDGELHESVSSDYDEDLEHEELVEGSITCEVCGKTFDVEDFSNMIESERL